MKLLRFVCVAFIVLTAGEVFSAPPRNVILMIGDGMGFEQVKAAGMYEYGMAGTLSFESMPYQGQCMTYSANNAVTDSAAAATAIATGVKVNNSVISIATPGDGHELETLLEYFKARGKRTGLVTTAYISHATPAGFGAHESNRNNYANIAADYLAQTRPNVLMGGAKYMSSSAASTAGYTVVTNRSMMQSLNTDAYGFVSGQFGSDYMPYEYDGVGALPHLHEMTNTTIDILDNDPDGFFLMVEAGRIDHAGHDNDLARNIGETIEFSHTVQDVMDWVAGRTDTLLVVTADHETGGLTVLQNNGQGVYPTVSWSTGNHTGVNVPVYGMGVNAEKIGGTQNNTDFFELCTTDEMPADLNEDRVVDYWDFSSLAVQWQAGTGLSDMKSLSDSWLWGKTEFVLWFDGVDDYVAIEGYTGIGGGHSRTCCAWVRTADTAGYNDIVGWGNYVSGERWLVTIDPDGFVLIGVIGGYQKGTTSVNDGQWHHVSVVLEDDGSPYTSEIKIYIDGVEESSYSTLNTPVVTGSGPNVQIGWYADSGGRYFKGLIDDVRIYDRVLTQPEIASVSTVQAGLIAHWKLNEGSGAAAEDVVSGHTGTLYGTHWLADFGKN